VRAVFAAVHESGIWHFCDKIGLNRWAPAILIRSACAKAQGNWLRLRQMWS
jgi:hypothetical protein